MIRVAAGIVRRGDMILLVKQQGDADPEPSWALPGGIVQPGETLLAGLRREIREETGLTVSRVDGLAWALEVHVESDDFLHAFVYEVTTADGDIMPHGDPDGYILDARFLPGSEAIELVERTLPWRSMREPLLAYLRGLAPPGTNWFYRRAPGGGEILELAIPGMAPSNAGRNGAQFNL